LDDQLSLTLRRYKARLDGIVSDSFSEKTVLAVGLGAGSYMIEKLARSSPRRLKLCDFDVVELENLSRTAYTVEDLGQPKVLALARHIRNANPCVQVDTFQAHLADVDAESLFADVDLIIAGTDQFAAQAQLNEMSVRYGIPAVFIAIHANSLGGRVIWTVPGLTPCYQCVAPERYQAFEADGSSATDLSRTVGSLVDCQFIDMVALKVVIAILERGQDSLIGRFFAKIGLRNDIVVRCDPGYEWGNAVWEAILSDLPSSPKEYAREIKEQALFSMDTTWLSSAFNPTCPVCSATRTSRRGGKDER
jgi:molybdopterin/thiamine biosynthesis adenylyltransferase